MPVPFHLAIPVTNLAQANAFYGTLMGCERGRSCEQWVDWNFFGHQLVTHLVATMPILPEPNEVDSKAVPVPHFGVVLSMSEWKALAQKLVAAEQAFVIEPYIRFEGKVGEQGTFFLFDPAGNALEFKGFADDSQLFAK
ncbi:MAG: extradiol dioxygenase family protein [Bermanella sp.]|mgnify:FL=1|jgi:extradiol dioxygenase family protein|uniref:VOC family protein n=1 Tax=Glaciecola sp. 33A TaxID=2057807 RepID=UPI000C34317E|nr:VOC family protein [Glaciecola sp. 33A]PKI00721.1 glyoxalase [Glaciecola sp. 33A]